jgi:SOS-response transcriptional repressor LexA
MSESVYRPSKKQRELLSFIDAFIKQNGYGPSYREIMNGLAYKSVSTVATHVDNLITKGHLRKRDYSARSLEVVDTPDTEFKDTAKITATRSKWLVDEITKRFEAVEADAKLRKTELDNLYVLVGALHVLGLVEPAMAFKRRLIALTK